MRRRDGHFRNGGPAAVTLGPLPTLRSSFGFCGCSPLSGRSNYDISDVDAGRNGLLLLSFKDSYQSQRSDSSSTYDRAFLLLITT